MAISDPHDASTTDVVSTAGTAVYEEVSKKANLHKALDFSNVGMPIQEQKGASGGNENYLRQFHQTRIFVKNFSGMNHHTKAQKAATYLISANLPQTLSYNLTSTWEAPLNAFKSSTMNAIMQFGSSLARDAGFKMSEASGIHRATTFLLWGGSNPLEMTLDIPVIDDNYGSRSPDNINANFVEALEFLSCLCLPSEGNTGANFYTPPPSPLNASFHWGNKGKVDLHVRNARIMVQLGGILLIDNCIIKGIDVSYPNTKTQIKHTYDAGMTPGQTGSSYLTPLLANVKIKLSTIEAMTANTYSKMLWLKPQTDMGSVNVDLEQMWNTAKNIASTAGSKIMDAVSG